MRKSSMRFVSLFIVLFGFWLLLSGKMTGFLVASGFFFAFLISYFSVLIGIIDEESYPMERIPRLLMYVPWIVVAAIRSAWVVTRIILSPSLPISPVSLNIPMSQRTVFGMNIHANSVTFTPGTLATEVSRNRICVHALTEDSASDLLDGAIDRWVCWVEGYGRQEGEKPCSS